MQRLVGWELLEQPASLGGRVGPGKVKVEERAFQVETKPFDLCQTPWTYVKLGLSFLMRKLKP